MAVDYQGPMIHEIGRSIGWIQAACFFARPSGIKDKISPDMAQITIGIALNQVAMKFGMEVAAEAATAKVVAKVAAKVMSKIAAEVLAKVAEKLRKKFHLKYVEIANLAGLSKLL